MVRMVSSIRSVSLSKTYVFTHFKNRDTEKLIILLIFGGKVVIRKKSAFLNGD